MSESVFSQCDPESLKRFSEMSDLEKHAVLALLHIPQLNNTEISPESASSGAHGMEMTAKDDSSHLFHDLVTPNAEHSESESLLTSDELLLTNRSLNNSALSTDHPSNEIKHEDPANTEILNVFFNTINLDELDKESAKSQESPEVGVSPCSLDASLPQDVCYPVRPAARVNSACSEEVAEAFQGQFLETLRTKNDGSARRPMNAYMLFCKMNRTQVKEKHPGLSNREISQILGKIWHDLDKEEWQKYTNMAFELRKAHYVAYPDFKWSKKQKRPASFPSKRTQLEEDVGIIRPRSTLYPGIDIERNVLPYKYKPFDYKKELSLPHPSYINSVNNHPRISSVSPFRIDNLIKPPDNNIPVTASDNVIPEVDDVAPIKRRKVVTPNPAQLPLFSSEQILQHYLIPNLVTPIPALFRAPVATNLQALTATSMQSSAEQQLQQANQLHLAIPMYHTGTAHSLMGQSVQLVPADVKSHYLSLKPGLIQNTKLVNEA